MLKKYSVLVVIVILLMIILIFDYQKKLIFQKENQLQIIKINNIIEINKRRTETLTLPILVYHYIEVVTDERDTIRKSLSILPSVFESQINLLLNNGYYPVKLSDLVNYYNNQAALPKKPVILSFDDGYKDFYTDVYPILTKHQIPAMLYVTSKFIDYTHNYLTKDQLLEISRSGLIEIGAHGTNHYNLSFSDPKTANDEIMGSKIELEAFLSRPVQHYAYAYGGYSEDVINILKKSGYETAVTMDSGTVQSYDNRYVLKRIRPGSAGGDYFLSLLK